jgi:hypothetical protein
MSKMPHNSVKNSNVRIEENQTTINPPLPASGGNMATTKNNFDVSRGAAMTGAKAPKDSTRIDGTFPGGK